MIKIRDNNNIEEAEIPTEDHFWPEAPIITGKRLLVYKDREESYIKKTKKKGPIKESCLTFT